ncbi:DUF4097 family beta strand repeat-containing protein [Lactococcus fujiensis]|uniref:DUF4097 family beta strand repeat-containing protein n=1 Tax=Lactococcus fujiensis TaxID=610251 RepID=UPI000BDE65D3|nr:DUF4097 family beta strand repeat-containing protein [Lactococcus fujiensis]
MEDLLKNKLNSVFSDYQLTTETKDLYDEVLSNLRAAAKDLKADGKSDVDAAIQAFSEIGDLTEVLNEITNKTLVYSKNNISIYNENQLKLANDQTFNPTEIESIKLSYSSDNVEILASSDGKIHLYEYMNSENPDFFAQIQKTGGHLSIQAGVRPRLFGVFVPFRTKIILALPVNFTGDLDVDNRSGNMNVQEISLSSLMMNVRSGNFKLADVEVQDFSLDLSSGNGKFENLTTEKLYINAKSGNLKGDKMIAENVQIIADSGNCVFENVHFIGLDLKLNSGNIKLLNSFSIEANLTTNSGNVVAEVVGFKALKAKSDSGNVRISVPRDMVFDFDLKSGSGSSEIALDGVSYEVKKEKRKTGSRRGNASNQAILRGESGCGNVSVKEVL